MVGLTIAWLGRAVVLGEIAPRVGMNRWVGYAVGLFMGPIGLLLILVYVGLTVYSRRTP